LDLCSFDSVRQFVDQFKKMKVSLDILVNNAGVYPSTFSQTKDRLELMFQVNYLSPFLLTNSLLDTLSPNARIVNVNTSLHTSTKKIQFEDLELNKGWNPHKSYAHSKLLFLIYSNELQRRLKAKDSKVTVNSLHPGAVKTDLARHFKGVTGAIFSVAQKIFITPEKAAHLPLYLASDPDLEGKGGEYWSGPKAVSASKLGNDEELAKKLWKVTETLVGYESNSISSNNNNATSNSSSSEVDPVLALAPGEGEQFMFGSIVVKTSSDDTSGQFSTIELNMPPNHKGPPKHRLMQNDESWYVLEGEIEASIDEKTLYGKKGSFFYIPKGHSRTLNSTPGAKMLISFYPSGFERYFEELSELVQQGLHTDFETMKVLQTKYGMELSEIPK